MGILRSTGLVMGLTTIMAVAAGASEVIDRELIENPRRIDLDGSSAVRWERLFTADQRWIGRDLAFIEAHNQSRMLTLWSARLLYRGGPWSRRLLLGGNDRWRNADREIRLAVLRVLRRQRDSGLGDVYCAFLAQETDPALAISALINLYLVDPSSAVTWAVRLADPRHPQHLPASQDIAVRTRALELLVESSGVENAAVRQPLAWALLNASGAERNHALRLVPRGGVADLLSEVILRLAKDYRSGTLDEDGRFALVLAASRITGMASRELVEALMQLAVTGDRALSAAAATALSSGVSWDVAIAVNDLADRAATDPDSVIRQTLMALLVRLDPQAVSRSAGPGSPWTRLADHVNRLQQWEVERSVK